MRHSTKSYFRILSFILVFILALLKENDLLKKSILIIPILSLLLLLNVIIEFLNIKKEKEAKNKEVKHNKAKDYMYNGLSEFKEGLRSKNYKNYEQAIIYLNDSKSIFFDFKNQEHNEVLILNALGLAYEKLAYQNCSFADIYTFDSNGQLKKEIRKAKTDRITENAIYHPTEICCTEVSNIVHWENARITYYRIWEIVTSKISKNVNSNLECTRSAGYFFMCDYLIFGKNSLDKARDCLEIYNRISQEKVLITRIKDSEQKLNFLKAIENINSQKSDL